MRLWLWYVPGNDEQIAAASAAAEAELQRRGITVPAAFAATVEASNYEGDESGLYDAEGVAAWFAAERIALDHLAASTGEYPERGALIMTEGTP